MFESYSEESLLVVMNAIDYARLLGHRTVTTSHILYGLTCSTASMIAQSFATMNITQIRVEKEVLNLYGREDSLECLEIPFSKKAKRLLAGGERVRTELGHKNVLTCHLTLSGIGEEKGFFDILTKLEVNPLVLENNIRTALSLASQTQLKEDRQIESMTREDRINSFSRFAKSNPNWRPLLMTRLHTWSIDSEEIAANI
ncbi:hypothetical protein KBI23_09500 [bacterium]|nr:hypothetical protein [bacterium]MBP9810416.1 hypothetical protein [bacterium]